jgi:IS5 family transposase
MVRRAFVQRSLVEVWLPDGDKLWDPTLRAIDAVLTDDGLVDQVVEALSRRHRQSRRRGRLGTPAEVVLRMLVLKHLFDWSFDECEREVRGSLVYRPFCRIDGERVPDAKTLIRLSHCLGPDVLKGLVERLVALARQRRVVRGRRLRVDTTVVETNIHDPTDSALLADGVRVLTRTLTRLRTAATDGVVRLRDRTRSVARRVFTITQLSRQAKQEPVKVRMRTLYCELMGRTRAVVREAELVRRVLAQTRARVLRGNTRSPAKLLSLFEPHTEAIRKGKAVKPTEFGKLVKIQEGEAQFITDYAVCETRVSDHAVWVPSLVRHEQLIGRAPRLAVADGGFASRANERAAYARGVRTVVLLRQRRKGCSRTVRAALKWRTGCEGRISALKRRHGLRRCRYRGLAGMERWVGARRDRQ